MENSKTPNGLYIFVQNGNVAHSSIRSSIKDTKQASKTSVSHGSTAQIDVPHTHGVFVIAACMYQLYCGETLNGWFE